MTSSHQLKALIRNKSRALNVKSNIILQSVVFDFFLEKLALSKYTNHFIIKGGFLVSAITKIDLRTTMDLDVTLKSLSLSKDTLESVLIEIISLPTHDLLMMELIDIVEIHDNADYQGLRATVQIFFDGIKEFIKLDFTTGDIMTPTEMNFSYKTVIEKKEIKLKSYNLETLLAEKLETILSRGILNTRMRDFYDVYILFKLKEIDLILLKEAFNNTSKQRRTFESILQNSKDIFDRIRNNQNMKALWTSYQVSYPYASDVEWKNVIDLLSHVLEEIGIITQIE